MKITVSAKLAYYEWPHVGSRIELVIAKAEYERLFNHFPILAPIMLTIETKDTPPAVPDGTTLWVLNDDKHVALAYDASTHLRDSSKDIPLTPDTWNTGELMDSPP